MALNNGTIVFISKETAEIQAQCLTLLTKYLRNRYNLPFMFI